MRHEFKLPRLADTVDEYVLVQWLAAVGDQLDQGAPLVRVETDKTEIDLDAPFAATLAEVMVAEGDDVSTGQAICILDDGEG